MHFSKRKLGSVVLALGLGLVASACGSDGGSKGSDTTVAATETTAAATETTAAAAVETTPAATETTAMAVVTTAAAASGASTPAAGLRIKYVINGTLGDKSFIDSAYRGLTKARDELGYKLDVIELGYDETKWQPGLEDAAAGNDYDILVAGSFSMSDYVGAVAPKHPDKKFWVYDAPPDYSGKVGCSNKCSNVYSVTFKQNEGSYLVGYAAGKVVVAGTLPGAKGKSKVGIMGGVDIPVINDFIVGFKAGFAAAGAKESDVLVQYVGGDKPFGDPAKGKEIALAMYDQGAAIVWGVAGGSGNGVFEAAVDKGLYAIGVDSDQYVTLTDPAQRKTVLTSMLKNVDAALFRAAAMEKDGKLTYGAAENVGIVDNAVGVAKNENFDKLVSPEIQAEVDKVFASVASGQVKVPTAFA